MERESEAVPNAKSISGFLTLPQEVYEIILANLHYDKRTICSLASTNHHLYSYLGTLRFRDVVIRLGFGFSTWQPKQSHFRSGKSISKVIPQPPMHNDLLNSLHNLISNPAMLQNLQAIKSMTIKEGPFTGLTAMRHANDDRLKNQWTLVRNILQQAIALKSFCYDCCLPFPIEFLNFLEAERPHVRVEILKWYQHCDGPELHNPFLSALAKSPSLKTISLGEIQCCNGFAKSWLGRIIKESPSLTSIRYGSRTKVRSQHTRNPCCDRWQEDSDPWCTQRHKIRTFLDETLPCIKAVEELKIAAMQRRVSSSFPFNEFWMSFLDLSKLRILDLAASNLLLEFQELSISNPFTALKKLSFTYNNMLSPWEAIYRFLDSCSLEALAVLSSCPLDIERLLSAQTATLSFLLIDWYPTATDLYFIRDRCASLEFLGIRARLPHEDVRVCNVLVTFERLRCLRIRISSLSMAYASPSNVGDGPVSDEDWEEVMLAVQDDVNPNEDAVALFWKFIALKWCGKQLPKVAIRGSYHLRARTGHQYRGNCEAFWVIEPKGKACPGSTDADFYRGFDLVGFENYKVASFPDAKLGYPKIPMPYADRVDR